MAESRVWIRKRECKGKTSYHLRWICPVAQRWKSERVGTDIRRARAEAAKLEERLADGTYRSLRKTTWQAFIDEVVGYVDGRHAEELRRALDEFTDVVRPVSPMTVRPAAIRRYEQWMKRKTNAVPTINKKLRYLRLAFNHAIDLDYATVNPLARWTWQRAKKHQLRILKPDEEVKLLASCRKLYGDHLATFARFTLETWGRLSEVTGLLWVDVDFDDRSVTFLDTKSGEDRYVPIAREADLWGTLRVLQAKTMQDGGPFAIYRDKSNLHKKWKAVVKDAGIPHVTVHDLRRTGITRALLANVALVTVQELAGHKSIATTRRYYVEVSKADKRAAVEKRHATAAG